MQNKTRLQIAVTAAGGIILGRSSVTGARVQLAGWLFPLTRSLSVKKPEQCCRPLLQSFYQSRDYSGTYEHERACLSPSSTA